MNNRPTFREWIKIAAEYLILAMLLVAALYAAMLWASTEPEATKHIRL